MLAFDPECVDLRGGLLPKGQDPTERTQTPNQAQEAGERTDAE